MHGIARSAMSDSARSHLRQLLLGGYSELKARLAQRLGSAELAGDVLQDTWLRLEHAAPVGPIRHPKSYLLRIAYNIALKRRLAEPQTVTLDDARTALDLLDDAPDPAAVAEGRSDVARLKEAVAELTPRQQDILLASRLDNVPLAELAARYGISQRWVERELRRAVLHCARRLDRNIVQRFGPRRREGSRDQEDHARPRRRGDDADRADRRGVPPDLPRGDGHA
jgi:RNA polymerase sigma-70 factor, ECF subfamily